VTWDGIDRRKGKDFWYKTLKALTLFCWILFLIALLISFYAAPEIDYGILRYHDISIRDFWKTPLTGYLYIVLWVSAFLSYLSLMINHYRSRRNSDNRHYNLMLLLLICICWVIYIMIKIKGM
jgi:hypothetical protein